MYRAAFAHKRSEQNSTTWKIVLPSHTQSSPPLTTMSRTAKLFTAAANALQKAGPELAPGNNPTIRHWAIGKLKEFPVSLQSELSNVGRLKSFSNWTVRDLKGATLLTAEFGLFFVLGEMYGRGMCSIELLEE